MCGHDWRGALKLLGILSHLCAFLFGCMYLNIPCACLQESSLMVLQASLKGELEANQQQLESSKVTHLTLSLSINCRNPFVSYLWHLIKPVFVNLDWGVWPDSRAPLPAGAAEVCVGATTENQQLSAATHTESAAGKRHCQGACVDFSLITVELTVYAIITQP